MQTIVVPVNGDGHTTQYSPIVPEGYNWRVISYSEDYTEAVIEIWEVQIFEENP